MATASGIPRTRGGLCGVLLVLLGAWGALVPFVGPYFHFAYTPDQTWRYTSGRLWLEIAPGAAAVVGGLIVAGTRSRLTGGLGAFLAALGGAWFVAGAAVVAQFVKNASISPGVPVGTSAGAAASSLRQFLEGIGFFTGTGLLIVFFAALALGRFSVGGGTVSDEAADEQDAWGAREVQPDQARPQEDFRTAQEQYPTMTQYPAPVTQPSPAGQVPPRQDALGQQQEEQPTVAGQFPSSSSSSVTGEAPSPAPSDPGQIQF
jgi:hypothetical protein